MQCMWVCGCDMAESILYVYILVLFIELALITNKPRAASVYAVGHVTCAGECEDTNHTQTHNSQSIDSLIRTPLYYIRVS